LAGKLLRKVIISRKGFDSGYGKVPSPLLPDGRMISLPIPDKDAPITYGAIQRDEIAMGQLVADLTRGKIPPAYRAHLDPDLDRYAVARPEGWRPSLGQSGAALGHLRNEGVRPGDLFLFFGWFRPVERFASRWRYVPGSPSVHAFWGWMQIDAFHACSSLPDDVARWAAGHPHLSGVHPNQNDIIVSSSELSVAGRRLPGSGTFRAMPERVLTEPGATRSTWRLPSWFHPETSVAALSYHGDRGRWSSVNAESCRLLSVSKGQEFVLHVSDNRRLDAWLADVFADIPSV
jgi:hypothetical protein